MINNEIVEVVDSINLAEELRNLETQRDLIETKITSNQLEIDQAKANQKKNGIYMDAEKFVELRSAVRSDTTKLH
jgi:hypothetical protein